MTGAALAALLSHWRRNPLQLVALVAGLALATALWSGVRAINSEARASYDAAAATLGEGRFDQLLPRAGDTIPQARFVALRRAGWQVSPVLEGTVRADGARIRIVGLDPLTAPGGLGPVATDAEATLAEVLLQGAVFADAAVARRLAGVFENPVIVDPGVAPGTVVTDIGTAQRLLGQPGVLSRLIVAQAQPLGHPPLAEIAPDLMRQAARQNADPARLTDSFHLNLTAFGLLSFVVGLFIVHGAIGLAFEQRRAMVRTLRALGLPLRRLVLLMAMEIAALALLAGTLGVVLGYFLAALLLPDVAATLQGLYGARVSGTLHLRPEWWLSGIAMALIGSAVAAARALWQIARMPLLASAHPRAWAVQTSGQRRIQAAAALGLAVMAVVLLKWGEGLVAAFALVGAVLVGAALALPVMLDGILSLCQRRAGRIVPMWFWADTRQQLPGLSLALMALLLAMAANVGVSTMVSSFRLTFVGFLDQRLAAELYVSTENAAQSAALQDFLAPRAHAVLPVLSVETRLAGRPAELYGARVGPTYRDNWAFLAAEPAVWDRVAAGTGVIVNEQLARRAGLWTGDTLAVAPARHLPIVGVVGDYGNPVGQAIVDEAVFRTLYPEIRATRFGLRTDDPAALRDALVAEFGLPKASIIDQAGIKALSLRIFERTFTVTGALNILTLAVAGFAILMSLLTLAAIRVPQLAPAWALGLTRRHLGWLELARAVVLAALTAVLALPLGVALAWMLLAVVNVAAFGWRLPMHLFPLDYARLGLLALVAAVLAALWPAWRLARMPPAHLLKVFANER